MLSSYLLAFLLAAGTVAALDGPSAKKQAKTVTKVEPAQWKQSDTPMADFLFLVREMPDFGHFPKEAQQVSLSCVAAVEGGLLFMEGCTAARSKQTWSVSGCKAVRVGEKEFLARLVAGGADTAAATDNRERLGELLKLARKAKAPKGLAALMLASAVSDRKGYKASDDLALDQKACGDARFAAALAGLPEPAYAGSRVVVIDLSYVVDKGTGASYKTQISLAKTPSGWRFGNLRVRCY